ncbi:MAG: glycosyltransferase family 4 protein [Candidatus Andersenbacteria bacterium]|nr:glycosyltransferase family 4 protein [Candidatus Andersenbacteria bacterium]
MTASSATNPSKLRIASVVTGSLTTPQPPGIIYAPIDLAVALTIGLTERGHTVTYFAPEGSSIPAGQLETGGLPPLKQSPHTLPILRTVTQAGRLERIDQAWTQALIAHMLRRAEDGEYDLVHIHPIASGMPLALSHPRVPVVYTLHDPISPWRKLLYTQFSSANQWLVSISQAQRAPAPDLPYAATIYNGVDTSLFPFSAAPGDYLLFVGRMQPNKGVIEAIQVARLSRQRLILIGTVGPEWQNFWRQQVAPSLNDQITYTGFVTRSQLYQYYQRAKALLMPIQWEEPFGLVMTEAMACGTPVIALRRGSVPEVLIDGQTGFIVDTINEMASAVEKIDAIKRTACRQHVEQHFSLAHMVAAYEKVYYQVLAAHDR